MNILLYITIFVIGMIFGALTTLLCRIKLKQKVTIVKPYILRATLSGIIFVLFALSINLNQNTLTKDMLIYFIFTTLYISILFIIATIDKNEKRVDKIILLFGFIVVTVYMIYTYVTSSDISIYRYATYLLIVCALIIADTIYMKLKSKSKIIP